MFEYIDNKATANKEAMVLSLPVPSLYDLSFLISSPQWSDAYVHQQAMPSLSQMMTGQWDPSEQNKVIFS